MCQGQTQPACGSPLLGPQVPFPGPQRHLLGSMIDLHAHSSLSQGAGRPQQALACHTAAPANMPKFHLETTQPCNADQCAASSIFAEYSFHRTSEVVRLRTFTQDVFMFGRALRLGKHVAAMVVRITSTSVL